MFSPDRQSSPTKIVGPAYTVKYAPLADPQPKISKPYIDTVPHGAVLFVSCPPKIPNAVYGGLMSTRAHYLGAVGSVIDGRCRDLDEHRGLGYPVFARDVGTAPPAELLKVVGVNVPVKLAHNEACPQDMEIRPGDILIGDLNGVVVLPAELAEQALELIRKGVAGDDKVMEAIRGGMSFEEATGKFRVR